MALDHSSQFHRVDLRNTPRVATEALVRAYPQLPNRLGEPATSLNSITDVLRESGRQVLATDLIDYEIEDPSRYGCDFLLAVGLSGYLHEPAVHKASSPALHGVCLQTRRPIGGDVTERRSWNPRSAPGGRRSRVVLQFRKRLPMMHRPKLSRENG